MNTKKSLTKMVSVVTVVLFLTLIFGMAVAFWILPDQTFSVHENRSLQTLPHISVSAWLDGSLTRDFTTYCSDQFPLRTAMVGIKSAYDLALGRGESSGVLLGKGQQQAVRLFDAWTSRTTRTKNTDYIQDQHVAASAQALASLRDTLSERDVPLYLLLAPRTVDVTISAFDYPAELSDHLHDILYTALDAEHLSYVDMTDTFRARFEAGDYIYYRTDHHWTASGAYLAYAALMQHMGRGEETLPADVFTVRQVPDFYGTTYSRAGMYFVLPDTMELWEAESDALYVVSDDKGKEIMHGFINESYLAGKDKYGALLDGTHRLITVTQSAPDPLCPTFHEERRPRLLLARDSFASAMIPYLARHFDIVAVNLSDGMTQLSSLCEAYACDAVLVLCNLENLVTSDCMRVVE